MPFSLKRIIYRDYATLLKVLQHHTELPTHSQNTPAVFSANNGEPLLLDFHGRL